MKRSIGEKTFNIFNIIFMTLFGAICLFPYLNQLAYSLNDGMDSLRGGLTIFPRAFTLANYKAVLTSNAIWKAAGVTVSRVILKGGLTLLTTYMAAYVLSRKALPYRKGLSLFLMLPSYISAGVIPTYVMYRNYGLIDNYLVYILPGLFVFYYMIIIRSFLQDLPESLEESAKLDGANDFTIMVRIIMPISLPVIACVALWVAVDAWNDWNTTLLYVTNNDLYTLQYHMMRLIKETGMKEAMNETTSAFVTQTGKNEEKLISEGVRAATVIVTTIPIIMVYPFLQKYFISGITLGAVKG